MRVMSYETKFQMSNTEVAALLDKISLLWSVIYTVSEKSPANTLSATTLFCTDQYSYNLASKN